MHRPLFKSLVLAGVMALASLFSQAMAQADAPKDRIVLVHGAFVDGTGWQGVYRHLTQAGFEVSIVQLTTESLEADVANTLAVIEQGSGPVTLVGHSYGGAVISQAGNAPQVANLVYVAALVPGTGQSVDTVLHEPLENPLPDLPLVERADGRIIMDPEAFAARFAGDVDPSQAEFMAQAQRPLNVQALLGEVAQAAWQDKPSWYIVSTQDQVVAPELQRRLAARIEAEVIELEASHAVAISQPSRVAGVIMQAATQD